MATPNTTPTPNELYNGEMEKMCDTELRVVLIVTRATLGWVVDKKTGMRKQEDWISQKQLIEKSGRSNKAISTAIKSCVERGWIEARDKNGTILASPKERSGRKVFYRLGRIFLDKISTDEDTSQDRPVNLKSKTCELNDIKPVKKVHTTKEILTKENIQNITEQSSDTKKINDLIDLFKIVNPSYKTLFGRKVQRSAAQRMLETRGWEELEKIIQMLPKTNTMQFAPKITTPLELEDKMAKLENDNKAVNVKRGLKTRCEMGYRPGVAPTGYLNEKHVDKKCQCRIDPKRAPYIKQMFEKVANEQWSGRKVYMWLRDTGFKTKTGKLLVLGNVYLILRNPFYYGEFEYPVGSGNWYNGKHTPIINKELFDKVQLTLNENFVPKTESKEFAFTKLIKCGYCGSGISADEKFKKLKDGGVNRHVYYFCSKARNIDCKNPAINEPNLIDELINLMDKIDLDELGVKSRIEQEIARFNKFRIGVLGHKKETHDSDVDVRNYTKYLLREGTLIEKRELLFFLKSKLILKDKKIILE